MQDSFKKLQEQVICCRRCPRLVKFRETVPARASFKDETYWRRPVPGFGDPNAWLLILGLAPAAHGGNRTGRIFTGDESGRFLFHALYKAGLSNQPLSESPDDGLKLIGCYITAAVKCAPPQNRPLPQEFFNCSSYLANELLLLKKLKAVLALGKFAFDSYLHFIERLGEKRKGCTFSHGAECRFDGFPMLIGSYHPSPQNTYTGKLTEKMFISLLDAIKKEKK